MRRALGISVHTGWAACVVAGGTLAKPIIDLRAEIELLGDDERFVFHMAAEMKRPVAEKWVAEARAKALANAKTALSRLLTKDVTLCAIVAKPGNAGELDAILASHPRLHTAEGCLYRDVLREASTVPVHIVSPASLDVTKVGKIAPPPWAKDQKLAALAAWTVLAAPVRARADLQRER
jgi:hypothetical protein